MTPIRSLARPRVPILEQGDVDAVVLVAVAGSATGMSASELLGVVGPSVLRGQTILSRARRAAAVMVSLAGSGLLVRNAGRTARYSITKTGLESVRLMLGVPR